MRHIYLHRVREASGGMSGLGVACGGVSNEIAGDFNISLVDNKKSIISVFFLIDFSSLFCVAPLLLPMSHALECLFIP